MAEFFANDVVTRLFDSVTDAATSLTVLDGSAMPATGNFRLRVGDEIMTCTARSGNTLTVARATEPLNGTQAAAAHAAGAFVSLVTTNGGLRACYGGLDTENDWNQGNTISAEAGTHTEVIGATTYAASLFVSADVTDSALVNTIPLSSALQTTMVLEADGDITQAVSSYFCGLRVASGNTRNYASVTGKSMQVDHFGSGALSFVIAGNFTNQVWGSGTMTNCWGAYVGLFRPAGTGTVGNYIGVHVDRQYTAGLVTTQARGLVVEDFSTNGAPSNWNIYSRGIGSKNFFEGQVGVGVASPNAAARLQVDSTTQGFLPPRMTETQRDNIGSPPAGLVIYNTTTNVLNFYNGSAWGAV